MPKGQIVNPQSHIVHTIGYFILKEAIKHLKNRSLVARQFDFHN